MHRMHKIHMRSSTLSNCFDPHVMCVWARVSKFKKRCCKEAVYPNCMHTGCNRMFFVRAATVCRACPMLSPLTCAVSLLTCSDQSQRGSLFTLFLYSPLLAFSSVCGLNNVRRGLWERAQEFLRKVYRDIGQMLTRSRTIGKFFHLC